MLDRVNELFSFDYQQCKLLWKTHIPRSKYRAGDFVAASTNTRYPKVYFDGHYHPIHHITWMLHNQEEIPDGMFIDHEDGDTLNWHPDNLRLATNSQNQFNAKLHIGNKLGVKGVSIKNGYIRARIQVNGKRTELSGFSSVEEAEEAIRKLREKLHKEFSNHGYHSKQG